MSEIAVASDEAGVGQAADAASRGRRRRAWGWVALVVALVVVGIGMALIPIQQWQEKDALDPEHPGPTGGMALAELLRGQGIDVEIVRSRDDAMAAAADGTLVINDTGVLSDADLTELIGSAQSAVLIDPSSRDTRITFGDGETSLYAGTADVVAEPACDLPEPQRAGGVQPGMIWQQGSADTGCYPVGSAFGLLSGDAAGAEVVLVDGTRLFDNEHLAQNGNASLGIGLLGTAGELVWYVPSPGDVDETLAPPTLGELTPPWLSPAIMLAAVAAVACGIWRGRRFGPLVAETLPVTVRGSETLEGRARLYQRTGDAAHAADLVRRGAVARMAVRLGLNLGVAPEEVADAAAARIGANRADARAILAHRPTTDADLADFGNRIRDLEAAVDAAVRTERKTL
ncbi:DUF4350 domain-containing protein [Microbacterium halotolerans]|uniref:DUF4350 domain-containing protein n=1 Tax=Microbacterium halotolerans TaxID=246613 RepID=UPI001F09D391|nr:DUF4350 domain-containing protein [Microbacterium halotolerans]